MSVCTYLRMYVNIGGAYYVCTSDIDVRIPYNCVCVCVRVCTVCIIIWLLFLYIQGHAVVTDMKILSWSQTAPHDYYNIATTEDDSEWK